MRSLNPADALCPRRSVRSWLNPYMGLDGVEIVMRVEERFGITLTDAEAEKVTTPAMLIDLVLTKVAKSPGEYCQSQRAFYLLRQAWTETFSVTRNEVSPSMTLMPHFRGNDHSHTWEALREHTGAQRWPTLARPQALDRLLRWSFASIFLAAWVLVFLAFPSVEGFFIALSVAVFSSVLCKAYLDAKTAALKTIIPASIRELRDLIPFVETSDRILWTRCQVAVLVREIVTDILALKAEEYWEQADFVKDLRLS